MSVPRELKEIVEVILHIIFINTDDDMVKGEDGEYRKKQEEYEKVHLISGSLIISVCNVSVYDRREEWWS